MKSLIKNMRVSIVITFILVFALLFLQLIGKFLDPFYFKSEKPVNNSVKLITSNDLNFSYSEFGVFKNSNSSVLAVDPNSEFLFAADRLDAKVNKLKLNGGEFTIAEQIDLKSNFLNSSVFIYDLEIENSNLYVSLGIADGKNCDVYSIISFNLNNFNQNSTFEKIWTHDKPCLISKSGHPDSSFSGRILIVNDHIFLTGGLIVTNISENTYPNSNLTNLPMKLQTAISQNLIFGSVTKIRILDGKSQVFTTGHRTPQGIAAIKKNNQVTLFATEHGPRGGDELNILEEGENYGWPFVTYGQQYKPEVSQNLSNIMTSYGSHNGFKKPIYYWSSSIAISQLEFLKEDIPNTNWKKNDLIITCLKCESILHVKLKDDLNVISIESIFLGRRIRDIEILNRTIFLSTDSGSLISLVPLNSRTEGSFPSPTSNKSFVYKITHLQEFIKSIKYLLK
jgi:hypothetical protein